METSSKPILGYWKIRGLGSPIRYLFEYTGVEYEETQYEQGDAPDYSVEVWTLSKPTLGLDFPNLPYLIYGDVKLTETIAILRYICNKWAPELLGKTPEDKAFADMTFNYLWEYRNAVVNHSYSTGDRAQIVKIGNEKLGEVVGKVLLGKKFVCGDDLTYVDFFLFEKIEVANFLSEGEFLKNYPIFIDFHKRITSLPRFSDYYNSDKFMRGPFNNKIAKINN